jgi:hypothetical protein
MNGIRIWPLAVAMFIANNHLGGTIMGQYQKETVAPPIPIGDRFAIQTPQGEVSVKNFYPTALIVGPQSLVMDVDAFSVTYDRTNQLFFITVRGETRNEVIKHRKEAEAAFLRLLGVTAGDACRLQVKETIWGAGQLAFNPNSNLPLSFCVTTTPQRNNENTEPSKTAKGNVNLVGTTWKIYMTNGTELGTYTFLAGGRIEEDEKAKWKLVGNKLNITEEYGNIDLIVKRNLMTGNGQLGMNPRPFRLRGIKARDNSSDNSMVDQRGDGSSVVIHFPSYVALPHKTVLQRWLTNRPELRPATDEDCKNELGLRDARKNNKNYHPYYVTGDFNSDGRLDFAVVLIDERKSDENKAALLVFNGPLSANTTAAYFEDKMDLFGVNLFFFTDRPKPYRLLVGPFNSDSGFILEPRGKGYIAR